MTTTPTPAASPRAPLTRPDGTALRVLAVDDERSITELLSMALRYEGWDVRTAASGTDAVSGEELAMRPLGTRGLFHILMEQARDSRLETVPEFLISHVLEVEPRLGRLAHLGEEKIGRAWLALRPPGRVLRRHEPFEFALGLKKAPRLGRHRYMVA